MDTNMWEKQETIRMLKGLPGTHYQEADELNKAVIRDWVRNLLVVQPATVTFIKANGSERAMRCTLNWDLIPAKDDVAFVTESEATVKKERKQSDLEVIKVYDLDASGWRSFRMDRLKKISAEIVFDTK